MVEIALPPDADTLESIPGGPAVFLLWAREGEPFLARTNVLRRRVIRMLESLQGTAERLEYYPAGSKLESRFLHLELARRHLGPGYRREIRLRLPPYVKMLLSNEFPRTQVAMRLAGTRSLYVGPFRNRSTAAAFESAFLDLFQLRRCQEDLAPSSSHPGCIYGEMSRCLRPCQQMVSVSEYRSESDRVAGFLRTGGRSLIAAAAGERERLSADMNFEGAARAHQRLMKIEEVLSFRDEMARDVEVLHAVAVVPSAKAGCVELGWLRNGYWQGFRHLDFATDDGTTVSLDSRLREMAGGVGTASTQASERMEHLAILSRWFYSSWCDGELLMIDDWEKIPWRKLVNAVSRVATAKKKARSQ